MPVPLQGLVVLMLMCLSTACAYYYDGIVAELDEAPDIKVVLSQSSYGDCFRKRKPVPVVYVINRAAYALHVVHGNRYWPELFLVAQDSNGATLDITGEGIQRLRGGTDVRLVKDRGIDPSHQVLFDLPLMWDARTRSRPAVEAVAAGQIAPKAVTLGVRNAAGQMIGEERFTFRLSVIECRGVDAP